MNAHNPVVAETDEEILKHIQEAAVQAKATHMHVSLYMTEWVATQWEHPVLKATIDWIPNQKVQNRKHLLEDDTNTEGMAILWEQKNLMLYQKALYHCHTLAGKMEEVLQFVVPMAHQVAAMNGCHWDAGHQDQQCMLYLLQDWFWWPYMAAQMQKVISNYKQCTKYEGTCAKLPMQPIIATTPLELLHIDFISIAMTMELDQPPNMVNVLVFCNHFMKHIMA